MCVLGGRPQIRRKHLLNVTSIALRPGVTCYLYSFKTICVWVCVCVDKKYACLRLTARNSLQKKPTLLPVY